MQLRPIDQPDGPKNELNYYHCIAANIPFDFPMQHIVEVVSPNSDAEELVALRNLDGEGNGYILVPHQLHVFKEKLPKKFASVTYFLQPVPKPACGSKCEAEATEGQDEETCVASPIPVEEDKVSEAIIEKRKRAHELVIKYFTTDGSHKTSRADPMEPSAAAAMVQSAVKEVVFKLAQPKITMNATRFLDALDEKVEMLKKDQCADVKKLRTWILTKVDLNDDADFTSLLTEGTLACSHIGSAASTSITAVEWAWLRTQHRQFPQTATSDLITAFFVKGLHPLFTYKDTIVV